MADIIRQLPDSVANQIAAGEVIQRPASVIKELVENAVDAGATQIQIVVKDAGRTLIQVVDDGKGMSPTDARMAFERHATSKISAADDLFRLHTMGFRGEALPSICAISQVELRTMARGESLGTRLLINGSKVESQEPDVCTQGCNFMVKNLFYNTPARRKFLKSDNVELGAVMREFERLALVNNEIRMSIQTGTRQVDLRAGSLKQRISELWRGSLDMNLLPVNVETSLVKITGYISRPEAARRRNALQFLIVNGRNMRHPYFHRAIVNCYEGLIAQDTQPCYFLKFEVDPATIDINIHPTKNEIKFEHELEIRPILTAAVRASIGKFSTGPTIDFTQDAMTLAPPRDGDFISAPTAEVDPTYNPFKSNKPSMPHRDSVPKNWDSLYTGFMSDGADLQVTPEPEPSKLPIEEGEVTPLCIQVEKKYIITPCQGGVTVVDQHRAHVKILYERYMRQTADSEGITATQRVMFPEHLSLDASQMALLTGIGEDISRLGFTLEYGEDGDVSITGVPASLTCGSARDLLLSIIDSVADDNRETDAVHAATSPVTSMQARVALLTARAGAIRRGQTLSAREMEQLLADLYALPDPAYTPSGNPIIRQLPLSALASLF